MHEKEKPAFEIRDASGKTLCAVYADGRSEGLPKGITINRIPRLINEAVHRASSHKAA